MPSCTIRDVSTLESISILWIWEDKREETQVSLSEDDNITITLDVPYLGETIFTSNTMELIEDYILELYDKSKKYRLQIFFRDYKIPKYTAKSIKLNMAKGIGDVRRREGDPENPDWLLVTPFVLVDFKIHENPPIIHQNLMDLGRQSN